MIVRRLGPEDHDGFPSLLSHLHPHAANPDRTAYMRLLAHPGTSIWAADGTDGLTATATLHLLPNLTHGGRCYGLIENVVTARAARGRGHASSVMTALRDHAQAQDAYKLMLLSGKVREARGFYERLGYTPYEKHGLILRL